MQSRHLQTNFALLVALAAIVDMGGAHTAAHAQSFDTAGGGSSRASASAAAIAARIDLGLMKAPAHRSGPTRAEVDALRSQNRSLKIALSRAEERADNAAADAAAARAAATVAASAPAVAVTRDTRPTSRVTLASLDSYTGLVIDARDLPSFQRSPAPLICGPAFETLYPDARHVPTPDEVQDESVVRYYHTEDEARAGYVGVNPLVLRAVAAYGPGNDGVRLSAEDMAILRALDEKIHFSRNWKVGILVSGDR